MVLPLWQYLNSYKIIVIFSCEIIILTYYYQRSSLTITMKDSMGADTQIKIICRSKRLRNDKKHGEAGVSPPPPHLEDTPTSHHELYD